MGEQSIFRSSRTEQYFRNRPWLEKPYTALAGHIREAGYGSVGLVFNEVDMEYPLWILLKERGVSVRLEHVNVANESARLAEPPFKPEAVVRSNYYSILKMKDRQNLTREYGAGHSFGSLVIFGGEKKHDG